MMKALKIAGTALVSLVLIGIVGFLFIKSNTQKGLAALVYESIDMNQVADGIYTGEADAGMVFVKLEVTVSNHTITGIDIIEHQNGLGGKAEAITAHMLAANTYDVDAVSGATSSSEAIKSAVSNALGQGITEPLGVVITG
jgi:uncharacterized protein with FMN-binding domain